ncbi:ectoine/hydroxyectoine ABC transporter substrate-binding protein EhuB [Nocardiopsis composta]|uniref:Polar amino acid transport system substrate-binding protein n=1 Tax=Nocardiopsis composta TaxID=157465 RepID=A0A7W8QRM2_9ACTN|nr:ectoine/hydroxyectoine ABC transporter substrate-binding protein EhuB [Nocardiopsis composta]MBB5434346.1 polar amino acid transport system substrate-binding protein [Nocardiopsis composta]
MSKNRPHGRYGRRNLVRVGALGAAAVLGASSLTACSRADTGAKSLDDLREQGYITAAINNEPPFGFIDEDGETTGAAPELLREMAKELGIDEVRAESVAWDALIPGLNSGRYDVVAAGMYITPERCEEVAFMEPDYKVEQAFMVPKGNPEELESFETVAEKEDVTIAVLNASVEQGYARAAGVPDDQMELAGSATELLDLLENDRVDAVGLSTFSLNYQMEQRGMDEDYEVTDGFIPVNEEGDPESPAGGFAFAKQNTELRDEFNTVLAGFKEDGTLRETVEPFGFDESSDPGDLTTEQLCAAG